MVQAVEVAVSEENSKKDNDPRACQMKIFRDGRHQRQEEQMEVRAVDPADNKKKNHFKYEEKAYKRPRMNNDGVVHDFNIPQDQIFEKIKDQVLLRESHSIKTSKYLRNKNLYCA